MELFHVELQSLLTKAKRTYLPRAPFIVILQRGCGG
jgi:hypothetical protein